MKRTIALLLTAMILFALTACSGTSGDQTPENGAPAATEAPAPQTVADDASVIGLSFTAPEGYETVDRYLNKAPDGTLLEKSLSYTFADESEIMLGYTYGHNATEAVSQDRLDEAETVAIGGEDFKLLEEGTSLIALLQKDTVMYSITYTFADEVDRAVFDAFTAGIRFTDNTATEEDGEDLYDIRYTVDATTICSTNTTVTATPDGEVVKKAVGWHFGEDDSDPDYRFLIRYYKDSTVEEQKNTEKEYEEQEINGITFTVRKMDDDEKPFEYFVSHGDDVYKIYNNGSGGWFSTRSEESEAAFEALIDSIRFE